MSIWTVNQLFHNNGNGNAWLVVKPIGTVDYQDTQTDPQAVCCFYRVRLKNDLPLLLTEAGVDNGHGWNWPANSDAAKYQGWLAWFDEQIRQDNAVLGTTLFQSGDTGPQWITWDIEPIAGWLTTNLLTQPLATPLKA